MSSCSFLDGEIEVEKVYRDNEVAAEVRIPIAPWVGGTVVTVDFGPCQVEIPESEVEGASLLGGVAIPHSKQASFKLEHPDRADEFDSVTLQAVLSKPETARCRLEDYIKHLRDATTVSCPSTKSSVLRSPPPPMPSPPPPETLLGLGAAGGGVLGGSALGASVLTEVGAHPVAVAVALVGLGALAVLLLALLALALHQLARSSGGGSKRNHARRLPQADDPYDEEEDEDDDYATRYDYDGEYAGNRPGAGYESRQHSKQYDAKQSPSRRDSAGSGASRGRQEEGGTAMVPAAGGSRTGSTQSHRSGGGSNASGSRGGNSVNSTLLRDGDASEVASRLASRMNDLLDSLAPRGSRRRDRIDGAVRQELQGGADPIDILEALEHELAERVHKKLGTEPPPPPKKAPRALPKGAPVSLSRNNLMRMRRIQEAEEDDEGSTTIQALQRAAAREALAEEEAQRELEAQMERSQIAVSNVLKVVDDEDDELLPGETATMIQESIKPWDSISNVIPAPTVVRAQPNYGRPGYTGGPPLPR